MKRILKDIFTVLSISAVIVIICAGSGWLYSCYSGKTKAEFPDEAGVSPGVSEGPGSEIRIEFTAVIPESSRITDREFVCGENGTAAGEIKIRRRRWKWNRGEWQISADMRALTSKGIGKGSINVTVADFHGKTEKFNVAVPAVAAPRFAPQAEADGKLKLAPFAEEKRAAGRNYHWLWLLLIIPAAAAVLILRRRKGDVEMTPMPWEIAAAALENLRSELYNGTVLPEDAFIRLTDIVRNYLESRFMLPASRRTTAEFMVEVSGKNSPLPEKQRRFLHDFLYAADLIKFARLPSDTNAAENAAARAEELVRETVPQVDNTEKSK